MTGCDLCWRCCKFHDKILGSQNVLNQALRIMCGFVMPSCQFCRKCFQATYICSSFKSFSSASHLICGDFIYLSSDAVRIPISCSSCTCLQLTRSMLWVFFPRSLTHFEIYLITILWPFVKAALRSKIWYCEMLDWIQSEKELRSLDDPLMTLLMTVQGHIMQCHQFCEDF